ncbi:DUF6491 family protein [Hyphococcus formosus]|uniref:DUF6491 family protein n=1 Tax=Hyphococcus formosus TaxID=3143534 RepID=UPI00398B30F0
MKNYLFLVAGSAIALSACVSAQAGEDKMSEKAAAELAKYEKTGETQTCLSTSRIRSIDPIDDLNFLVHMNNRDVYLNKVSGKCHGASRVGNRLQYTITANQLCRNEIITVVDNSLNTTVGSCGLNSFEELRELPEEPAEE